MSDTVPREEIEATAGEYGVPVDAICIGCKRTVVKRAPRSEIDVEDGCGSFQHVCHACQTVQWWNVVAILDGIREGEES